MNTYRIRYYLVGESISYRTTYVRADKAEAARTRLIRESLVAISSIKETILWKEG